MLPGMLNGNSRTRTAARVETTVLALVIGLVLWFYLWTARPESRAGLISGHSDHYFNLLTRGFLKGQLPLDMPADPVLATLKNPWSAVERGNRGLHDATYYRGAYHLYFGATPALLLFLPFRLLTGLYVSEEAASLVFAAVGLILMTVLVRAVRARYFPTAPGWIMAGCAIALGLCTLMPSLLRRPAVWEVPITSAHACAMAGIFAIFWSLHTRLRRVWWLALASLALGLAVGARPTYLFGCAALLAPLWLWGHGRGWRGPAWRQAVLAAIVPLAIIGSGLALYNYARFDNPLEFGQRYQLNADGVNPVTFSFRYIGFNAWIYGLSAAGWSPYFPFVSVIAAPSAPTGYVGIENPFGLLPNVPFVLLGLGLWSVITRREATRLRTWVLAVLVLAGATFGILLLFAGNTNRYMVDFLPALTVLACVGWLALATRTWWRGWSRVAGTVLTVSVALYSVVFGGLASLRHNELLRVNHPAVYEPLARRANLLGHYFDRIAGVEYGPIALKVVFPKNAVGEVEPIVVTGRDFRSDYVYVHYLNPDTVRFCFEHTSYGGATGTPVRIRPGEEHSLLVAMGSLYPPAAHPHFDGIPEGQALLRRRSLSVSLDGVEVLRRKTEFYDAFSREPDLGSSGSRPAFRRPFSGRIVSARRAPEAAPAATSPPYGPLCIEFRFPPFGGKRSEPLVSSGESGRGNLLYVKYVDERSVVFGYDHWGVGGFETEPITVEPGAEQMLEVDYGALHAAAPAPAKRVILRLNGTVVADRPGEFYACPPERVKVGVNAIGASTASERFSGTIGGFWRLKP